MALLVLTSVSLSGVAILLHLATLAQVLTLARKPAPSLVQLSDGTAIKVQAVGSQERSLEVVQRFATDALILLMSWSNELPAVKGTSREVDRGAIVATAQGEKRITTSTFQASFTLSEELRDAMVKLLAEMTPSEVFSGQIKTSLKFQHVTVPKLIAPGQWQVLVVGTLLKYERGRGDVTKVPFNKELLMRAIDTPALPQNGQFANELETLVYTIRQAGLEITAMKDIEPDAAKPQAAPASPPSP